MIGLGFRDGISLLFVRAAFEQSTRSLRKLRTDSEGIAKNEQWKIGPSLLLIKEVFLSHLHVLGQGFLP